MRSINTANIKLGRSAATLLWWLAVSFFGSAGQILAHGGEDHGDAKPATASTTSAGTISRSVRLGDFEIMLKHPALEPDATAAGRLFITKFATNEPVDNANPAIEIESANGAVTQITIQKTDAVGSYVVQIPAMSEGNYSIRIKAVAAGGTTNTATFSGVEIAHHEAATETGSSWMQTGSMILLFLIALGLFGGLVYFARRAFNNKPLGEETVSA